MFRVVVGLWAVDAGGDLRMSGGDLGVLSVWRSVEETSVTESES